MSVQIDGSTGNIIATKADYSGDVSIGGTLTYEDVTNIDAVGLITARSGVKFGASGTTVVGNSSGIGVGTDNPGSNKLQVQGSSALYGNGGVSAVWGDTSYLGALSFDGSAQPVIRTASSKSLIFQVNQSTEAARFDSSGRMGLGTASPSSFNSSGDDLVVSSSGATGITINAGTSDSSNIYFSDSGNSTQGQIRYFHSSDSMSFGVSGSDAMRIDSSGRLLVGTTSARSDIVRPQLNLEGAGDTGLTIVRNEASASGPQLEFGKSRGTSTGSSTIVQDDDEIGMIRFRAADGTDMSEEVARITVAIDGTPGSNDVPGRITFGTTGDGASVPTERMRIDSSGRLLIGTTTEGQASADNFTIADSGHCGITIRSGTTSEGAIYFSDGTSGDAEYRGQVFYDHDGDYMRFSTAATERMRIKSDGSLRVSTGNTGDSDIYASGSKLHGIHNDDGNNVALYIEHSHNSTPYGLAIDFSDASPDNNTQYFINCFDLSVNRFKVHSDGDVDNHDNSYSGFSDIKLKQDIVDTGSQWDDIKNLRVRKFKFKSDVAAYGDEAKTLIGVVAQETELVSPGLVKESPDKDKQGNDLGTTTKSVRYSVLYMKAVKALQEAQTRIETLESQHADLLARVTALEG